MQNITVDSFKKAPTMNMKKYEIIAFMSKRDVEIPNPIPTKSCY